MSNDNTAKPTAGPWKASPHDAPEQGVYGCGYRIAKMTGGEIGRDIANAAIIAEAGTVHHETGLTPRQLVEQRDELLAEMRKILAIEFDVTGAEWCEIEEAHGIARAIIAKVEAKP